MLREAEREAGEEEEEELVAPFDSFLFLFSSDLSYLEHSQGDVRLFLGQDALVGGGGGCCCVVCVTVLLLRLRARQQSGLVVVVNEEKRKKSHCDCVCFYPRVSLDPLL